MFYTTCSRRRPLSAWKLDSGISVRFLDSKSLWPMCSPLRGWELGSKISELHLRGMDILRNDPDVIAVTVLEGL